MSATSISLPSSSPRATETVLECEHLEVGYDGRALLPGVAFSLQTSQLWAIVGDNGSGKTTLLKTLLGLHTPIAGQLLWQEQDCVGYVPQRARVDLDAPARVIDVVRGGVDRGWSFLNPFHINKHRDAIARAMRDTNTEQLAEQMFSHLSEGQKQRVLMARALASEPTVLVLDEPTSAMDMQAEHDVFTLLDRLRHVREIAIMLVSHHLPVVAEFATHVLLLDRECDMVLAGPIEKIAAEHRCRARYGRILQEGIERRNAHLCALDDSHDHIHGHDHHHDHAHTHSHTHDHVHVHDAHHGCDHDHHHTHTGAEEE